MDNLSYQISNISLENTKEQLIKNIKSKYNNVETDNIVQHFYERLGYTNINLPKEKEIKIKQFIHSKIDKSSMDEISNTNISEYLKEFHSNKQYGELLSNFNNKLSRALFLHKYIEKQDANGFLENCTQDELEYLTII